MSQFAWFSRSLDVQRERGEHPAIPITLTDGQRLTLNSDGRLTPKDPALHRTDDGTVVSITARSMEDAKSILNGMKRKRPDVDVSKTLASATPGHRYSEVPMHLSIRFGEPGPSASIVKTALAFAHLHGLPAPACDLALEFLNDKGDRSAFRMQYARDLVEERPANRVTHILGVHADPISGIGIAYVEYFSFQRVIVILTRSYVGPPIQVTYAMDPEKGEELTMIANLAMGSAQVDELPTPERVNYAHMTAALNDALPIFIDRNEARHRGQIIDEAVAEGMAAAGASEGSVMTSAQQEVVLQHVNSAIAKRMVEQAYASVAIDRVLAEMHREGAFGIGTQSS
ncbi:hypothetical protein [Luteibacter pinisoli]|uniref:hypothetical protein n=1 Tax=Luteibacter pinisoli TaxID=2589080 RepID=UPI001FE4CC27|nr:hypothetical protein [Luteibacter pinisoli]